MQKTTFHIDKMDCPAEEQLVRLKLGGMQEVAALEFDLTARRLEVYHSGDAQPLLRELDTLALDTSLLDTTQAEPPAARERAERKLLVQVLLINLFFFFLESLTGFLAGSMGLVADSLDMLADSLVYGLALFAVGGTLARKKNIATIAGYFQLLLAVLGLVEVVRRFFGYGEVPVFQLMLVISTLALIGNATSLYLLQKSKNTEAHMQASMIFTSNDVIINLGVILAGTLVFFTQSKLPDLIVGAIIFVIVARGAYRILQLGK